MSSVVGSTGKFGTSLDYSQMLDIRRKMLGVNYNRVVNNANIPNIKPHFNQDKFTSGSDNGSSEFYHQRGLYSVASLAFGLGRKV